MRKRGSDLHLVSLVLSLVNIDKCIDSNSEPEKCYPTKSTIHLAHLVKGELLSPEKIRATTGGIVTPPTFFKTALSHEKHQHPRLLKSIQTKLKTAPVTLRERLCIFLYYQFATMFTSLPGTTISLRIVLPSSDCAIASFAIFSSSSLSAAVGTFIRAFILPHS